MVGAAEVSEKRTPSELLRRNFDGSDKGTFTSAAMCCATKIERHGGFLEAVEEYTEKPSRNVGRYFYLTEGEQG